MWVKSGHSNASGGGLGLPKFEAMDHFFSRKGIDLGPGRNRQNAVGQLIEPYQVSLCESLIPRHIDVVDDFFVIECRQSCCRKGVAFAYL
jgi:hypothetical protein